MTDPAEGARVPGERRRRLEAERRGSREAEAPPAGAAPAGAGSVLPAGARRRPRWLLPALVAGLVCVVAVVVALVALGGQDDEDGGATEAAGSRTPTVLLGLERDGRLTGAALLAVGPEETSALLVPSRLVVDVAGGGRGPLADSVALSAQAPGNAVADVLDVRVDGTWLLTEQALAGLVDTVGGITVDVDAEVPADGAALAPGAGQQLSGAEAAAFATHLGREEAEAVRLARMEQVVSAVLAELPADPAQIATVVGGLEGSRVTLAVEDLADLLAAASRAVDDGSYGATVLPVNEIATGGDEVLYGLDDEAAAQVLASRFADVRREGGDDAVRVLVQNGFGTPGLGDAARSRLVDEGFRFVGGGNASTLGRPTSLVLVPSGGRADRDAGLAVADALGLPPDVVAVGQEAPTTADVVVVLGADFAEVADSTP